MKLLRIVGAFVLSGVLFQTAAAQVLFTYTFSDVTQTSGKTSAGGSANNIVFSDFAASANVSANSAAANLFGFDTWSTGATNGTNTFTGSVDPLRYYEFTITPQTGYSLSLSNITFDAGRSSTGPRQFVIRTSNDSFTSNLSGTASGVVSIVSGNVFQFTDNTSTNLVTGQSVSLSAFSNLTTALTLRIYAYNAELSGGTFRIDNVAINGSVTAIPEPSTYAAIFGALALAGVMIHRRRKQA
jgi:hypothetical protein